MLKKLFAPWSTLSTTRKEVIGSCVQIFVFVVLLPLTVWILSTVFRVNMDVFNNFMSTAVEKIPYAELLNKMYSAVVVGSGSSSDFAEYISGFMEAVNDNAVAGMYVGMCLHATRILFKEWIPIPGLPIFQAFFGLLLGVLTLELVDSGVVMTGLATAFLLVLNVVLTIFTTKAVWKKLLDIFIDISLEFFHAVLTSSVVLMIGLLGQGFSADRVWTLFLVIVIVWLIEYTLRYIIVMKK